MDGWFKLSSDVQQWGLHLQRKQPLQFCTVHLLNVAFLLDPIRGVGCSASCWMGVSLCMYVRQLLLLELLRVYPVPIWSLLRNWYDLKTYKLLEYIQWLFLFDSNYTEILQWKTCWPWRAHCSHLNNAPLKGDTMPPFPNLWVSPPLWLWPVCSVFAWEPSLEFSTVSQFTPVNAEWQLASKANLFPGDVRKHSANCYWWIPYWFLQKTVMGGGSVVSIPLHTLRLPCVCVFAEAFVPCRADQKADYIC